eukprot:TRINITY_DN28523_c0_g1_i1.p1 TRINITY_DN28523_c0_g1~~TRINITY_DN28523_c0_g1_i1.p1  ORF type:complete len:202 (+),score=72.64 TRINITY_DN28523_c0_g1_i1:69-674(+)
MVKIGVLALQGAFIEHVEKLKSLGVDVITVRKANELAQCDGLIIPGGESTAMGIIAERTGFAEPLREFVHAKPTWGTCAGLILLSDRIQHQKQGGQLVLGGLNVTVNRNYFGAQVDSFENTFNVPQLGDKPVHAVFIRAPVIVESGPDVEVLLKLSDHEIVAVRQKHLLGTAFHPELSSDNRWHEYFVSIVKDHRTETSAD